MYIYQLRWITVIQLFPTWPKGQDVDFSVDPSIITCTMSFTTNHAINTTELVCFKIHRRMSSAQLVGYKGDDDDHGGHGDDPALAMSKM